MPLVLYLLFGERRTFQKCITAHLKYECILLFAGTPGVNT